jgi:uncharacterized protein (DUF1697 family)
MNTIFVAFLRAVNVGGRTVKMEALRVLLTTAGLQEVRTYIASGNVIFTAAESEPALVSRIETWLAQSLGFRVDTLLRTAAELQAVIGANPFAGELGPADLRLYVSFLRSEPSADLRDALLALSTAEDRFAIVGRELFCLVRKRPGKEPFSNVFVEKRLKTVATTRDWNTVQTIVDKYLTGAQGKAQNF